MRPDLVQTPPRSGLRAAVFLDRDGTLIEDRGHLASPDQMVVYPDTIPALGLLQRDFLLFIVTNQSGVAEGVISLEDAGRVNSALRSLLAAHGIELSAIYVCPHRRADNCPCIKPKPYFLHQAARDFGVDLSRSFVVGDHPHDVHLATNAGARGVYLTTGHGIKHLHELPQGQTVVSGIREAAEWIFAARTPATGGGEPF